MDALCVCVCVCVCSCHHLFMSNWWVLKQRRIMYLIFFLCFVWSFSNCTVHSTVEWWNDTNNIYYFNKLIIGISDKYVLIPAPEMLIFAAFLIFTSCKLNLLVFFGGFWSIWLNLSCAWKIKLCPFFKLYQITPFLFQNKQHYYFVLKIKKK